MLFPFGLCPSTRRSSFCNLASGRSGGVELVDSLLSDVVSTLAQVMLDHGLWWTCPCDACLFWVVLYLIVAQAHAVDGSHFHAL